MGLILSLRSRASALSHDISKQSKAKFEAIAPTSVTALRNNSQVAEVKEKVQPLVRTDHVREIAGDFTLRKEVFETKLRLEQFIRENTRHLEKQRQSLADIERLRTEVSCLQERILTTDEELQKVKTYLEEQNSKRQHVPDPEAQAPAVEVADGPEIAPPMRLGGNTIYLPTHIARVSASNRCLSCGFAIKPKDNYCMHCGQSLI
jgi:hypothetical protein